MPMTGLPANTRDDSTRDGPDAARGTDAWTADDNFAQCGPPALGERCARTIGGMDRPRPVRRPSPGEVVFIPGRATTWATPQQLPGQFTGLTAMRRRDAA